MAEAADELNQALTLAIATKEGDGLPEIYCLLGDAAALRHEPVRARELYAQCGQTAAATGDAYSTIRAQGSLARLEYEQGEADAADASIEEALAGIEAIRKAIPEQDLRTSFFSSMRAYYDLAIAVLDTLDRRHPGSGYAWQALLTAERARARMLLDREQDTAGQGTSGAGSAALLAQLAAVEALLRAGQRRIGATRGSSGAAELNASLARLTVRRDALSVEAAAATQEAPAAALTLEALQVLEGGKRFVLLQYWIGERTSLLWTVTPAGLRCFRLGSAANIEAKANGLLQAIFATVPNDPNLTAEQRVTAVPMAERRSAQAAAALRRAILPAGALPLRAETVVVVADDVLLSVPLATVLPGSQLLTEPSATFLMRLMKRRAASPPTSLPAGSTKPRIAIFTAGTGSPGSDEAALPFVATEAHAIRSIFGPTQAHLFTGEAATPEAIRKFPFDEYTIAHFASHATLNRENMQLTGMVLNRPAGAGKAIDTMQASMLWYSDVRQLHAKLDLVVLSEC